MQTQDPGNAVETSLKDMADKLHSIMEETMRVCASAFTFVFLLLHF